MSLPFFSGVTRHGADFLVSPAHAAGRASGQAAHGLRRALEKTERGSRRRRELAREVARLPKEEVLGGHCPRFKKSLKAKKEFHVRR